MTLNVTTKTGLNSLNTVTKKIAHKAAETAGEFIVNKLTDKIVNPKPAREYST